MVGLGDSQTDQRVAAVVVINPNKKTNMEDLLKWCNENMEEAEVMMMIMMFKSEDFLKVKTTNIEWSKKLTKLDFAHQP